MRANRAVDVLLVMLCIANVVLLFLLILIGKFSEPKIAGVVAALGILIGCGALLIRRHKRGLR